MRDNLVDDDYPVDLSPPDIERYREGNTDIEFVTTFDSGRPGPRVLVTAITHGNEIGGAIALDMLMCAQVRPSRGKLTFCFNNHMAYSRFDPTSPPRRFGRRRAYGHREMPGPAACVGCDEAHRRARSTSSGRGCQR